MGGGTMPPLSCAFGNASQRRSLRAPSLSVCGWVRTQAALPGAAPAARVEPLLAGLELLHGQMKRLLSHSVHPSAIFTSKCAPNEKKTESRNSWSVLPFVVARLQLEIYLCLKKENK